jgi:hypothetical protein
MPLEKTFLARLLGLDESEIAGIDGLTITFANQESFR